MRSLRIGFLAAVCAVTSSAPTPAAPTTAAPTSQPVKTQPAKGQSAKAQSALPITGQAVSGATAIRFSLAQPAYVTLVIDDSQGRRVRNLMAETRLPAGANAVFWDGYDDGTRDAKGNLVRHRVAPGMYRVRGLTHSGIHLSYEFPLYAGGNPPWKTPDKSGAWMADHSSPLGAVFLPAGLSPYGDGKPQVLLSSLVAEAGEPLILVDENARRIYGEHWFGWDGGIALARDVRRPTTPDQFAYVLYASTERVVLRALRKDGTGKDGTGVEIAAWPVDNKMPREPGTIGLSVAVYNGLAVVSVPLDNKLVFVDTKARKVLVAAPLASPRGVYFDAQGNLFAISDNTVKRFHIAHWREPTLNEGTVLIRTHQVEAHSLTGDSAGQLYVADWGASQQVKVFDRNGQFLRAIGKPGGLQLGLYDEQRMHRPQGLAIDDKGRLWVAEADHLPKRISVWNAANGQFQMAKYGPPHYGGGGTIDAADPTRAFYGEYHGLMEFALDWKSGTSRLKAIVSRQELQGLADLPGENWWPERPVHLNGRTYLVGAYQGGLRGNTNTAVFLLDDKTHIARPVAYVGSDRWWPNVANDPAIKETMPDKKNEHFLTWSDLNNDGQPQAAEFKYRIFTQQFTDREGRTRPTFGYREFYPQNDLSMIGVWGIRVPPPAIRADGVPLYDLEKAEFLLPPGAVSPGDEDGQLLLPASDGTLLTGDKGFMHGQQQWSYPARWDYNDASRGPGDMNNATRMLGPVMAAPAGEVGEFYAINGEKGNIFLISTDGLFIQQLGGDMRTTPLLRLPVARRGMNVDGYSFEDEHFHPTMTRTKAGEVLLVAGKEHSSIFRVTGWDSIKRHDFARLSLDPRILATLPATKTEASRQQGRQTLKVALLGTPPRVDGALDEWHNADWATIDASTSAALAVDQTTLFAAWKTGDAKLLTNGGANSNFLFKSGGALDLMIGTDPNAERNRQAPVAGDVRLLVTRIKGQARAILYRAVVPPTPNAHTPDARRVLFESPVGKVFFDEVRDVSADVTLTQQGGDYEVSIPLAVLNFAPSSGVQILGDIGILRGDGTQTFARQYWNNLNTAIVSDIPSEARLQPGNWGIWKIVSEAPFSEK